MNKLAPDTIDWCRRQLARQSVREVSVQLYQDSACGVTELGARFDAGEFELRLPLNYDGLAPSQEFCQLYEFLVDDYVTHLNAHGIPARRQDVFATTRA